ncbi:hypothetical protein AAGS40_19415 [Paraburkholderia sp. PREW-6R]
MSTPRRFKAPLILLATLVALFVGLVICVGIFGLLIKLFDHV